MAYKNRPAGSNKRIKLTAKASVASRISDNSDISDMMTDAGYLRQSSALINEALQKGFDVLQLSDGSIVTTGVKTVVYQYVWDTAKNKFVRSKASSDRRSASQVMIEDEEKEFDDEDA